MNKVTIKLKKIKGRRQVTYGPGNGRPAPIIADEVGMLEVLDIDGTIHSIYSRPAPVDVDKGACYTCALSPKNNRTLVGSQLCGKISGCYRCSTIFERIEDSLERL